MLTNAPAYHEKELIARVAVGEQQAFTAIVKHYQPIIYTYVLRISDSEILSEEIVQDAFLKVWLQREKLTGIENFGGWLYRVAANIAYDALRKSSADTRRLEELKKDLHPEEPYQTFTPTEELLLKEQYAELLNASMETLPPQQLEVFRLVKLQGMSREEAALQMGISTETVKSYLALALQKIRAYCVARMGALGLLLFLWCQ